MSWKMFRFTCRRSHTGGGDTALLKRGDGPAAPDTQSLSRLDLSLFSPSLSYWPCTLQQKGKSLRTTACWFLFVLFNDFLLHSNTESRENQATMIPFSFPSQPPSKNKDKTKKKTSMVLEHERIKEPVFTLHLSKIPAIKVSAINY